MGCVETIGFDRFPKQSVDLGKRVRVCFHYDTAPYRVLWGFIVRADIEEPYRTIIQLDNGRVVLASECQYHITGEAER